MIDQILKAAFIAILTIILVGGYFFQCYFILHGDIKLAPDQYSMIVGQIIGYTSGLASGAVLYWLGTSKSSSDKDATIATMANKGAPNASIPNRPAE